MPHIHIVESNYSRIFSHLRCRLPYLFCAETLAEHGVKLTIGEITIENLPGADIYIFSGVLFPSAIELVERINQVAAIVWNIDDDYWAIGEHNPASTALKPYYIQGLDYCLDMADWVLVTTEPLRQKVGRLNKTLVMPNLVDMAEYPEYSPRLNKSVIWAGSQTHWHDLSLVAHLPIAQPDRKFIFFGQMPSALAQHTIKPGHLDKVTVTPRLPNVGYCPIVPFESYQSVLKQLVADSGVGICPLLDNEFNVSKSPLKYLEFGAFGLPVVCSPTVYGSVVQDGVNGLIAETEAEWIEKISAADNELGRAAYEWVRDNGSWQSPTATETWLKMFLFIARRPAVPNIIWG